MIRKQFLILGTISVITLGARKNNVVSSYLTNIPSEDICYSKMKSVPVKYEDKKDDFIVRVQEPSVKLSDEDLWHILSTYPGTIDILSNMIGEKKVNNLLQFLMLKYANKQYELVRGNVESVPVAGLLEDEKCSEKCDKECNKKCDANCDDKALALYKPNETQQELDKKNDMQKLENVATKKVGFWGNLWSNVKTYTLPVLYTAGMSLTAWIGVANPFQMNDCIKTLVQYLPMLYSGNKLNKITEILNNNSDNSKSGWWTTFGKYIGGNWLGSVVSWVVPALDKLGVFSKWGDSIIKWAPFTEGAYVKNTVTFIMLYSSLRDTLWNSLDMKETVIPNQSYSAFDRFIVPFVAALRCYYTISDNKEQRGELLQQFKDGAKSVGDGISRAVNTVGDGIKSVKDKTQQLFNGSDGVEIQTNLPYRRRVS